MCSSFSSFARMAESGRLTTIADPQQHLEAWVDVPSLQATNQLGGRASAALVELGHGTASL
jgi:hypothetical protein